MVFDSLKKWSAPAKILLGVLLVLLIEVAIIWSVPARRERLLEYFGVTNTVRQDAEVEYVNGDR